MEPSLNAGQQVGKYRILSFLGAGGMGEVFLGEDPHLGRRVALKLLPREATRDAHRRQRFVTEARAASALNHPHIVTIYEMGRDGDRDFIATEYIEGESLRELLRRGSLPTKRAIGIIAQAASALTAAHGAGIVHRDIKPENLMVSRNGDVKVLDYGLAKLVDREQMAGSDSGMTDLKTAVGQVLGTVAYMSPEQAEGRPVDHRSDIFSLGVVIYEALTGKRPFEATSSCALRIEHDPSPITGARFDRADSIQTRRIFRRASSTMEPKAKSTSRSSSNFGVVLGRCVVWVSLRGYSSTPTAERSHGQMVPTLIRSSFTPR